MDRLIIRWIALAGLAMACPAIAETTEIQARAHLAKVDQAIKDGAKLINARADPGTLGIHSRRFKSIVLAGNQLFGDPWDSGPLKYCSVATHRGEDVWSQSLNLRSHAGRPDMNDQVNWLINIDKSYKEALSDCHAQIRKIK